MGERRSILLLNDYLLCRIHVERHKYMCIFKVLNGILHVILHTINN